MLDFQSIADVDISGKTLIVRVDINSSVVDGKLRVSGRMREHAKTIAGLSDRNAKVVVLAHQGRPGKADFISLEQHAAELEKLTGKKIKFLKWSKNYISEIKKMQNKEIVLMDNVRLLEDEMKDAPIEEHGDAEFVSRLAGTADYFVLDGLSVAHRRQASVVGFSKHLPCYAGRVVEMEINAFDKGKEVKGKRVLLLGGAKVKDSMKMIMHMLGDNLADVVLCGGLVGDLFLKAEGVDFGKKEEFFKEHEEFSEQLENAQKVKVQFGDKIKYSVDVALDVDGKRKEIAVSALPSEYESKDIGKKTAEMFAKEINSAKLVIWNGPMGIYELPTFGIGTRIVAEAIAKSNAYSVIGGGDTQTAIEEVGLKKESFSYLSLSGKASLNYLAGKELPGLSVLTRK